MPAEDIDDFMNAIGTFESGNNYNAIGPYTGPQYKRARGRYQIMETIYPGWAREAGVFAGDPEKGIEPDYSPAAQDKIARFKMTQYYRQFGSWELVAVAWFAGPGRARKAQKAGIQSLAGMSDVIGTSVPGYVKDVMALMGNAAPENPRQADLADSTGRGKKGKSLSEVAVEGKRAQQGQQVTAISELSMGMTDDEVALAQRDRDDLAPDGLDFKAVLNAITRVARDNGGKIVEPKAIIGSTGGGVF